MKYRPLDPSASPRLIGLTGNIGTGKSTVAEMLAQLGADTIDADEVVHEVMRAGAPAHAAIVEMFGPDMLTCDGEIDRARLGESVFANPAALTRLEEIVHPATLAEINRRVIASAANIVVIEAIKLIEAGIAANCESVWVTTCRTEQQIRRIMEYRGLSQSEAEQRVRAQSSQEEKIARADVVIDTSRTLSWTKEQVRTAWKGLMVSSPSE